MKWGRAIDYHGSRSYGGNEAPEGRPTLVQRCLATIARLRKSATPPSSSTIMLADEESHFSLLGSGGRARADESPANCPFPTDLKTRHDPRDWRVFP